MKTIETAFKLSSEIRKQYDLLSIKNRTFFTTYHDSLKSQLQGVDEELDDMEYYFNNPSKPNNEHFLNGYQNLESTLKYCTAVIELQNYVLNLPNSIY